MTALVAGDRIGPYQVRRRLGSGGMGTVYLCEAAVSCPVPAGKPVAVKVLRSGNEGEDRRRFEREARYLQSLRHPGIIRLLDTGEHDGHPYLVMPYVDGRPVDALVKDGRGIDQRTAAGIAAQALEALHVAHLAGILHRDLKPGNLMVDDQGKVRLLDFGLAAGPMGESRLTATGDVLGTPVYMSPEQASGMRDHLGPRTDIYSIGACLYELLTGRPAFDADNSMAVLRKIIDDPLEPPSRLRPDLARDLETVVMVAMAKEPRDRYRSAEEMAADLRRFLAGRRVRARRTGRLRTAWRLLVRHRRTAASAGLVLFVALTGVAIAAKRVMASRQALPDPQAWVEERLPAAGLPAFVPCPPLGPQAEMATLPPVSGPVRLTAVIEIDPAAPPGSVAELLASDPDIGRGYRLRLELGGAATGSGAGDRLLLLRQDRLMASRDIAAARGRPLTLVLEHADVDLRAVLEDPGAGGKPETTELRFLDLAPIQGPSASGIYLVRRKGMVQVRSLRVERHRGGEFVSALALADDRRLEGNFARAAALYEEFLRNHPDSPQARDARLRLAVCQAAVPTTVEQAYAGFTACAQDAGAEPAYVMVATFHAWSLALRLNRYEEAEHLFEAIRSAYDLPTLAAAVPEQTMRQLRDDYFVRAEKLEIEDPERAVRMYLNCAEIARFIDNQRLGLGLANAGDLLMGLGRFEVALETFRRLAEDGRLPDDVRRKGAMKVAEAQRMLGDLAAAEATYLHLIEDSAIPPEEARWARLWLGDLYCQLARPDRAAELWREGAGDEDLPGRIMRHLVRLDGQIPAQREQFFANDIDYFNGRMAWLQGDLAAARDWFQRVASGPRPHDWPAPLARAQVDGRAGL